MSGIRPSESWFDEKHLWGRQTLRLAVYRSPPLTVRVHHCLGCSSQKWQQRVTLKGPGVQLPENVTGLADRTRHRERGEDVTKTTTLKCYRSLFLSQTCAYSLSPSISHINKQTGVYPLVVLVSIKKGRSCIVKWFAMMSCQIMGSFYSLITQKQILKCNDFLKKRYFI